MLMKIHQNGDGLQNVDFYFNEKMESNDSPRFDDMNLNKLGATLESVSKDESGETKKVLGKNYRALPFIERYKEEPIREIIMQSKAELDEEFFKKLMELLKEKREFTELFPEIKPIHKIESPNRDEDEDFER